MNNDDIKSLRTFIELITDQQSTLCVTQFAGRPLGSWRPRLKPI